LPTEVLQDQHDQHQAYIRVLTGLRYSYEDAGGIIEDLDFDWGATCRPSRLCNARLCWVFRFDGKLIHFAAEHGLSPEYMEATRRSYPIPPGWAWLLAQSGHRSLLSAQNLRPIDLVFGQNPCLAPRGIPPFIPRRQCHHRAHIALRG